MKINTLLLIIPAWLGAVVIGFSQSLSAVQLHCATDTIVTIKDDDSVFAFASPFPVREDAGEVKVEVMRYGADDISASVAYATEDGSAMASVDYVARAGTVTFAARERTKTLSVPILNNGVIDPESWRSFALVLYRTNDPTFIRAGGLLEFDGSGEHLSHRNEGGPVSPHPGPLPEEREKDVPRWGESARVGFANSRSRIPPLPGYPRPSDGRGAGGEGNGSGEGRGEGESDDPTAECVPMVASAGGWPEGPNGFEPFIVSSLRLCRRSLTFDRGAVIIEDNDTGDAGFALETMFDPRFNSETIFAFESRGVVEIPVVRHGADGGPATVRWRAQPSAPYPDYATATPGSDFTVTTGMLVFAALETPKNIVIPLRQDGVPEPEEWFGVMLEQPSAGMSLLAPSNVLVLIQDAERPGSVDADFRISQVWPCGAGDQPCLQVSVRAIRPQPDGKILIAGNFCTVGGVGGDAAPVRQDLRFLLANRRPLM